MERRRESMLEGVRKGYEHAHLLLRRTVPGHATASLDGRQAALQVCFVLDASFESGRRQLSAGWGRCGNGLFGVCVTYA